VNKLSILSISFSTVFILIWFQLKDQNRYRLQNNFGINPMNKAPACMFRVQWFLTPPERASIPRWSLCRGPIIIGNSILWLFIWHCPVMNTYSLVDPFFPSIHFARSSITLLHLSSTVAPFSPSPLCQSYPSMNKQTQDKNIRLVVRLDLLIIN
jgi:hypothetical protein